MDEVFNAFSASSAPSVKQPEIESLGQYLRRHRQQRQVSIEEMSWATKIKPEYLMALETGDFSGLPGETFTRGYLKSYAQYVGLQPQDVLAQYVQCGNEPCTLDSEPALPERVTVLSWVFGLLDRIKRLLTGRGNEQVY